MDWFVKAFLKSSLVWLVLGVTSGVMMALHPAWTVYRPAHVHMVMLGFVTMMIYGVAYHVVPRFAGVPLYDRRAAGVHCYLSNVGLLCMIAGFAFRGSGSRYGTVVLTVGGVLAAIGAYLFAYLLWRTLDSTPVARPAIVPATIGTRQRIVGIAAP